MLTELDDDVPSWTEEYHRVATFTRSPSTTMVSPDWSIDTGDWRTMCQMLGGTMKVEFNEAFLRRPPRGGIDSSVRWVCEYLDDALAAIKPDAFEDALWKLIDAIPDDQVVPRPKGFGEKLLRLRDKVQRYSLVPSFDDLDGTWETLLTKSRCLKPAEPDASYDVPVRQLLIESAE